MQITPKILLTESSCSLEGVPLKIHQVDLSEHAKIYGPRICRHTGHLS